MSISSISLGAASAVNQNYAALNSAISSTGQNPTVNSVTNQDNAALPAQASMDVLKQSMNLQASAGAQLAQMVASSGVDITA